MATLSTNSFVKQNRVGTGKLADAIYKNNTTYVKQLRVEIAKIELDNMKAQRTLDITCMSFRNHLKEKHKKWIEEQSKISEKMRNYVYKYKSNDFKNLIINNHTNKNNDISDIMNDDDIDNNNNNNNNNNNDDGEDNDDNESDNSDDNNYKKPPLLLLKQKTVFFKPTDKAEKEEKDQQKLNLRSIASAAPLSKFAMNVHCTSTPLNNVNPRLKLTRTQTTFPTTTTTTINITNNINNNNNNNKILTKRNNESEYSQTTHSYNGPSKAKSCELLESERTFITRQMPLSNKLLYDDSSRSSYVKSNSNNSKEKQNELTLKQPNIQNAKINLLNKKGVIESNKQNMKKSNNNDWDDFDKNQYVLSYDLLDPKEIEIVKFKNSRSKTTLTPLNHKPNIKNNNNNKLDIDKKFLDYTPVTLKQKALYDKRFLNLVSTLGNI